MIISYFHLDPCFSTLHQLTSPFFLESVAVVAPVVDVAAVVVAAVVAADVAAAAHNVAPLPARSSRPRCGTTVAGRGRSADASWECLADGDGYRTDRNLAWDLACQSSLILET